MEKNFVEIVGKIKKAFSDWEKARKLNEKALYWKIYSKALYKLLILYQDEWIAAKDAGIENENERIKKQIDNCIRMFNNWRIKEDFRELNFENISFKNFYLSNINLKNAILRKTDFTGSLLQQSVFQNSVCDDASFWQADCSNSNFTESRCIRTVFLNTKLSETVFKSSNCHKANFMNADCVKSKFNDSFLDNANFKNAVIDSADFSDIQGYNVNFFNSSAVNTVFRYSKLDFSNFQKADLTKADFRYSAIRFSEFDNRTKIRDIQLFKCKIENSRLKDAEAQLITPAHFIIPIFDEKEGNFVQAREIYFNLYNYFSAEGENDKASSFFIKQKNMQRHFMKENLKKWKECSFEFREYHFWGKFKRTFQMYFGERLRYQAEKFFYYAGRYGESPLSVFFYSLKIMFIYVLIYMITSFFSVGDLSFKFFYTAENWLNSLLLSFSGFINADLDAGLLVRNADHILFRYVFYSESVIGLFLIIYFAVVLARKIRK